MTSLTRAMMTFGAIFLAAFLIGDVYGWRTGLAVGLIAWALMPETSV